MDQDDWIDRIIDRSRAVLQAYPSGREIARVRTGIRGESPGTQLAQKFKYAYWDLEPDLKRCNDAGGEFNTTNFVAPDTRVFVKSAYRQLAVYYINLAHLAWISVLVNPALKSDSDNQHLSNPEALSDFENIVWAFQIQAFGPVASEHAQRSVLTIVRQAQFTLWFSIESARQAERKDWSSESKLRKFIKKAIVKLGESFAHTRDEDVGGVEPLTSSELFLEDASHILLYEKLSAFRRSIQASREANMTGLAHLVDSLIASYLANDRVYPELCKFVHSQYEVLEEWYSKGGADSPGGSEEDAPLDLSSEESLQDHDDMHESKTEYLFNLPGPEQYQQLSRLASRLAK